MRKVIYGINLSADGCCQHDKFGGSEEIMEFFTDIMWDVDLIVYGRKTYELMVPYWPDIAKSQSETKAENEFALTFSAIDKVVFSRTLKSAGANTRIVNSDLGDEIQKLKQQAGKNISLGGVDLPSQLVALGLVDEFYFVVHPVIVGEGRRLFDDTVMSEKLNLKLVDSKPLPSGCVALHYVKQ